MRSKLDKFVVSLWLVGVAWMIWLAWSQPVKAKDDKGMAAIVEYGDKTKHSAGKAKLNVAFALMTGHWNDVQKTIMLRLINDPTLDLESEVSAAFTPEEARDAFYRISFDVKDLRAVYGLAAGKSATVRAWNDPDRVERLWQMNWALGFVRFDLTYEQQLYLVDLAEDAGEMTKERASAWDARAVALGFPREVGRALFTTVGTEICPASLAVVGHKPVEGTCICTTHSGNWSCNDSCHGAGSCSVDPGNCGFMWQWDCNGTCNAGNIAPFET